MSPMLYEKPVLRNRAVVTEIACCSRVRIQPHGDPSLGARRNYDGSYTLFYDIGVESYDCRSAPP